MSKRAATRSRKSPHATRERPSSHEAHRASAADEAGSLYAALGYRSPVAIGSPVTRSRGRASFAVEEADGTEADVPPADELTLDVLDEQLRDDPETILERVRQTWDGAITEGELRAAIGQARSMLRSPRTARVALEAAQAHVRGVPIPPELTFDGYDPVAIPLDPDSTKFQTKSDAPRWVMMTAAAITGVLFQRKAPFRWHSAERPFVYKSPAPSKDASVDIALLGDFGTGLPHSRYIAKQLATRQKAYDAVIHVGDVYYAGRSSEFAEYFIQPLAPVVARSALFTQIANHEMFSKAYPYFAYMDARRAAAPRRQVQEGSYFALRFGDLFQVIGIDTDYFGHARFRDENLRGWLSRVLHEGRAAGAINILLPANEPYEYAKPTTTALFDDLRPFLPLVDAWFWGNTHYCALFDRTGELPVGSCVGHGGYPYLLSEHDLHKDPASVPRSPANVRWAERAPRYPRWTGIRQETGNNGYCEMRLNANRSIDLVYRDWMSHDRCLARLARGPSGALEIVSCVDY